MDAIAGNNDAASLKVLSAETGLHPSTAFRILASLTECGWVERDGSGNYRHGRKIRQLARHVGATDLERVALPIMEQLRDQLGETINLTLRQGDEVIYIGRALSRRVMRVEQVIGSRAPLHVTAVGKLMLGEAGDAECRAYAARTGLPKLTPNTIADVEQLLIAAAQALQHGYALDNEEAEPGVGCIGVLIRDRKGAMVAGLSVSAPIERREEAWIPTVQDAGWRISERMGGHAE